MKKLITQVGRFTVVGAICFLIDYFLLYIGTEYIGFHYLVSGMISFCVSVTVNYWLSSCFVFEMRSTNGRTAILFVLLSLIGLLINEGVLVFLTEWCASHYMLSKIAATGIVTIYNFVSRKMLIEEKSIQIKKGITNKR